MGSGHSHSHDSLAASRSQSRGKLLTVVALASGFLIVEVIAGLYTGSLALLADAGHMLGDVAALVLALVAMWFASRPATAGKTYGYYRSEILAALVNSLALIGVAFYILSEAYTRINNPQPVTAGPMLAVACGALVVNLVSMRLLSSGQEGKSLNEQAAHLEVLSDLLGSIGTIIAALVIMFTGWNIIDPIVSGCIGLLILPRTWTLVCECTNILMEGTPREIDLHKLFVAMQGVPEVVDVHDLHVWTITSGRNAVSAHVTINAEAQSDQVLAAITSVVQKDFDIHHSTFQVELTPCAPADICHRPPLSVAESTAEASSNQASRSESQQCNHSGQHKH